MFLTLQVRTALLILVLIISIGLMIVVYRHNRRSLLSKFFIILNFSLIGWIIPSYLALHPAFVPFGLFWPRLSMAFALGINVSVFLLSFVFANDRLPRPVYLILLLGSGFVLAPLVFTSYVFRESTLTATAINTIPGPGMIFFAAYAIFCMFGSIFILWQGVRRSHGVKRKQLSVVSYGMIGMTVGFIFLLMIPIMAFHNAIFVQFGGIYILIFLFSVAIAMLKYELFNIKAIATEALVILLNSFLFVQLAISNSVSKAMGNAIVFFVALVVSYMLLKAARSERRRRDEQIQIAALAESNRKLTELDKQKTEFLTIAAHQLRTPVSIINNYIGMLQDGDYGYVTDEANKILSNMNQSNQWLVRLADEFLNIANLEQGQTKFHFSKINIVSLITKVIAEVNPKADAVGLKIIFNQPAEPLFAEVDEEKIKHVLLNLMDNAVKYGVIEDREKQGEISIRINEEMQKYGNKEMNYGEVGVSHPRLRRGEGRERSGSPPVCGISIRIKDQGIGFDKDDEQRLFQKFSRGKNAKCMHVNLSTGLGLYIAKKFIEGHHGEVWAKSEGPRRGSEFGVWIPSRYERLTKLPVLGIH